MFRAVFWALRGGLTGIIVPVPAIILSGIGLVCGAFSKSIDLYEDGYNKDWFL